jgi:ubiquinone/menaquinone biosynthesis C-methylase UbiE
MSYAIDERNPERQRLLAAHLDPPTREILARLPPNPQARILDLGCGQGNTTRCLADVLRPASCLGIEFDPALVDYASTRDDNPPEVTFQQGDATKLPFPDASFDVAFCRYLLIHMTDPMAVVREMMRVVKPGGFAIAYEADFVVELSDPPCPALNSINKIWKGLFQNPSAGRRLVGYFRSAGATRIQAGALSLLEHEGTGLRRIYRLTAEATAPLAVSRGVMDQAEADAMVAGLIAQEENPQAVVIKFPDMWVIAQR